jgi:hypothetical protein
MQRIEGQVADSEELAKQVLSWITCAKRPLTTSELQFALAVEIESPEFDEENLSEVEDIVSVCAGLVTVDEESDIIRLVHYTTQEYFERTWRSWFPKASEDITKTCVTCLLFEENFRDSDDSDYFEIIKGLDQPKISYESILKGRYFYDYAAAYWGHHACGTLLETDRLVKRFLESGRKVKRSTRAPSIREKLELRVPFRDLGVTGAHLAAYFGLEKALASLIEQCKIDIDSKDDYNRTPLFWAVIFKRKAVVQLLLDTEKVDVKSKDDFGETPLSYAIRYGYSSIVKVLLDTGKFDVKSKDDFGETPLSYAVRYGNSFIVKLLLDTGKVGLGLKYQLGMTILYQAVWKGDEAVVKLLLDTGKVVVDKGTLFLARDGGSETMVKLLEQSLTISC